MLLSMIANSAAFVGFSRHHHVSWLYLLVALVVAPLVLLGLTLCLARRRGSAHPGPAISYNQLDA